MRAWGAVLTSIVSMAASLYLISISPWYLLPLAWALSGTAFTGVSAPTLHFIAPTSLELLYVGRCERRPAHCCCRLF